MKITEIETITIQLPGRMDYSWRSLQVSIGRYVILKLTTDEGIVGLGEAPAILSWGGEHGRYFGEDPEIVTYLVNERLSPFLIGADPVDIRRLLNDMDISVRGFPYTKAMIESAMLDIMGRKLGVPVYQLLGGAMRDRILICHSVGIAPPDDAARCAADVVADGIQWLQVKVPGEPDVDLAIIKAIRKEVGDDINIFPDINRGYRNIKPAINVINAMYGGRYPNHRRRRLLVSPGCKRGRQAEFRRCDFHLFYQGGWPVPVHGNRRHRPWGGVAGQRQRIA